MSETESNDAPASTTSAGQKAGTAARGVLGLVGSVVRIVTGIIAAVLLLQMVLVLFGANPFNLFAAVVAAVANSLTLGLASLFLLANPVAQVIVSYGIPAIAWLVIGSLVVAVLRAIARPKSGLG